jgi:hypothetical protein
VRLPAGGPRFPPPLAPPAAAAEAWPFLSYGFLVTVSPWGPPVVASLGPPFLIQLPKGSIPFGRDGEK